MVFRPFYVQKEFLRKILSLPDFAVRDSDDTQTVILENIIRSSSTFFYFWGVLKDCCDLHTFFMMFRFVRFLKCVLEHCNALFRSQQLVLSSLVISNSKTSFIGSILLQELIIQYSQNSALSKAKQRNLFRESPVSF